MFSKWIGRFFSFLRDGVAEALIRVHVTPNLLTLIGAAFTAAAAVFVALGPRWWPVAGGLMVLCGACDMLDGAVARLGGPGQKRTRFGGVLDSLVDRASDFVLYLGAAVYFLQQPSAMYVVLCWLALAHAYMISYIGARGGEEGAPVRLGFWQRGERFVTLLIGLLAGHLTTAIWLLATWPFLTVLQRVWVVRRELKEPAEKGLSGWLGAIGGIVFWRHRRGGLAYDVHAGLVIAILILAPEPMISWLKALL